jgi:hypothetical protein
MKYIKQAIEKPMKNQDDLYQNDVGSFSHNLAFTTWVIAIAAQKMIDVICFVFS